MPNEPHWFVAAPLICSDCGQTGDDGNHLRRCMIAAGGGRRPGFGFCRLIRDHDGPCEHVWWDGAVTRDGVEIERGRFSK